MSLIKNSVKLLNEARERRKSATDSTYLKKQIDLVCDELQRGIEKVIILKPIRKQ